MCDFVVNLLDDDNALNDFNTTILYQFSSFPLSHQHYLDVVSCLYNNLAYLWYHNKKEELCSFANVYSVKASFQVHLMLLYCT